MSQPSHILDIGNVTVAYGKKTVARDISLQIAPGEAFGLMGLNGEGKTTLIKTILGLRDAVSGTIKINGHDRLDPASRQMLAFLPERFDPPWFLRGNEFLKFSMDIYGRKYDEDAVRRGTADLSLDYAVIRNRVQTYSKGMRQKLGLLATVMTGCPLLILDEPMSGLDPRARARVKDMLLKAKAAGTSIFLSSHILADLYEICDRVAVLHDGHIKFTGRPHDMLTQTGEENLERAFLHIIGDLSDNSIKNAATAI